MKIIEPSVEYWPQKTGMRGAEEIMTKAARICYDSIPRKDESDSDFLTRVILKPAQKKDGSYDILKLHGGILEFGTMYYTICTGAPTMDADYMKKMNLVSFFRKNPYSNVSAFDTYKDVQGLKLPYTMYCITVNMRVIVENKLKLQDLHEYESEPTEHHKKRYTFHVVTDIGTTRELNRHRASMSIAERSTRYCDYSKSKYEDGISFIKPSWFESDTTKPGNALFKTSLKETEAEYMYLRKAGWSAEKARQILPLCTTTEAVYCAYEDDWRHFLALRSSDAVSGKPHPNMIVVADKIKELLDKETGHTSK